MKHLMLYEGFYDDVISRIEKTSTMESDLDKLKEKNLTENKKLRNLLIDAIDFLAEEGVDRDENKGKTIKLNYNIRKEIFGDGNILDSVWFYSRDSVWYDVLDKKDNSISEFNLSELYYSDDRDMVILAMVLDAIKEKFPEYFEGKDMGFFDLKTNETRHIKLYEGFCDDAKSLLNKIDMKEAEIDDLRDVENDQWTEYYDSIIDIFNLNCKKKDNRGGNILEIYKKLNDGFILEYICYVNDIYYIKPSNFDGRTVLSNYDTIALGDVLDILKEMYPEYFEGKNMGFFDLKKESYDSDIDKITAHNNYKNHIKNIVNFVDILLKCYDEIDMNDLKICQSGVEYIIKKIYKNTYNDTMVGYVVYSLPKKDETTEIRNTLLFATFDLKDLTEIYNYLVKKYPDVVEGSNMGFFDLKKESYNMKFIKLYENYYSEYNKKLRERNIVSKKLKELDKDLNMEKNKMIEIVTDIVKTYSVEGKHKHDNRKLEMNFKVREDSIIEHIEYNNYAIFVKYFESPKGKHLHDLTSLELAELLDIFKDKYPEYFEGKDMGFFDLKTESYQMKHIKLYENYLDDAKKLNKECDDVLLKYKKMGDVMYNKKMSYINLIFDAFNDLHKVRIDDADFEIKYIKIKLQIRQRKVVELKIPNFNYNGKPKIFFDDDSYIDIQENMDIEELAAILDKLVEMYPEYFEGKGMGFLDLKTK